MTVSYFTAGNLAMLAETGCGTVPDAMNKSAHPGRAYFVTGLVFLMAALLLTLAANLGEKPARTRVSEDLEVVMPGHVQIAFITLPFVLAVSTLLGSLGCIQGKIRVAQAIRRSAVWAAATGIVCVGLMPWWAGRSSPFDDTGVQQATWIGFLGTVLLFYALVVNFAGSVRYFVEFRRQTATDLASAGGKDMTAGKIYAGGGLLLLILVVLRVGLALSPWRDWVYGFSTVVAGMFVYPITAALGAASLFLSVLQPSVRIPERIKVAGAILFLLGTGLLFISLYEDLRKDTMWETITWPTIVGMVLLLAAMSLNLFGALRGREAVLQGPGDGTG